RLASRKAPEPLDARCRLAVPFALETAGFDPQKYILSVAEMRLQLTGNRLPNQRFAAARTPIEQHARGTLEAQRFQHLRVLQRPENTLRDPMDRFLLTANV